MLEDQAEAIFLQAREITFAFDREQWRGLDLLLNVINRSTGEEEQFDDLPDLILFLLGKKLRKEARENLLGGYKYPTLEELGKSFHRMVV